VVYCIHLRSEVLNNLAWQLATSAAPAARDGQRAVQLATRACELTRHESPMFIGTLAAAYAEAGQFTEAAAAGECAIALAATMNETNIIQRNRELLELYRAGKPFHESTVPK